MQFENRRRKNAWEKGRFKIKFLRRRKRGLSFETGFLQRHTSSCYENCGGKRGGGKQGRNWQECKKGRCKQACSTIDGHKNRIQPSPEFFKRETIGGRRISFYFAKFLKIFDQGVPLSPLLLLILLKISSSGNAEGGRREGQMIPKIFKASAWLHRWTQGGQTLGRLLTTEDDCETQPLSADSSSSSSSWRWWRLHLLLPPSPPNYYQRRGKRRKGKLYWGIMNQGDI